jgi:glycerol-3-phosphate dehydrogenase
VMLRRTRWHDYHPNAAEIAEKTAAWMSEILGWDDARREAELARYREME